MNCPIQVLIWQPVPERICPRSAEVGQERAFAGVRSLTGGVVLVGVPFVDEVIE